MMAIKDKILNDLKEAMKSRQNERLMVLRSLKAKILEKEISERKDGESTLTEAQITEVLMKAAKQRKESIEQFMQGNREDLAVKERSELTIIESYLPEMMSEEEIRNAVKKQIESTGAKSVAEMGKVMGPLMATLKGKADGSLISTIVKEELS